ncbi:MAG: photosystem I assembly protein Ycf3 [Pelotomaculum sp. PtaB.Bin104]|nr:MAG: photosystem I assembly protein Ycf3 [Pelotomaculum sp. PtaB.Bin104]
MIKIFLSWPHGDHSETKEKILRLIRQSLTDIGVEEKNVFMPDAETAGEEVLRNLRDSDLAIFLITPYYGSLSKGGSTADCPADTLISDIHCQLNSAVKAGKPRLTFYLKINDGVLEAINKWKNEGLGIDAIKSRALRQFSGLTDKDLEHYYQVAGTALSFINGELQQELHPADESGAVKGFEIKGPEDIGVILENIALEVLRIYERLAEENPEANLPNLAMTHNNLGAYYRATGNFAGAAKSYREALAIHSHLAEQDEDAYLPAVAMTQNNLGIINLNQGHFAQADQALLEARKIYTQLADKHPDTYLPALATTHYNLGIFYRNTGKLEDAETTFQATQQIYKKLAEQSPEVYLPALARTHNTLGVFYRDTGNPEEAEGAYYEALMIYQQLSGQNPGDFLPALAGTINNLAVLYGETGKFNEAVKSFQTALQLFEKLADANPEVYLPVLAGTRVNLGNFYCDAGKFAEAKKTYREAIIIYGGLADKEPAKYLPYVNKVKEIRKRLMENRQ